MITQYNTYWNVNPGYNQDITITYYKYNQRTRRMFQQYYIVTIDGDVWESTWFQDAYRWNTPQDWCRSLQTVKNMVYDNDILPTRCL